MKRDLDWLKRIIDVNSYEVIEITANGEPKKHKEFNKRTSILMHWIDQIDQSEKSERADLPEIPQYVAEWLEKHSEQDLYWILNTLYQHVTVIDDWFVNNVEKLIDAKRHGYTIEAKETIKVNARELLEQVELALDLEYLKPVKTTRGERFGRHGYTKEITRDVELNEVIELSVDIIEKEMEK